MNWRNILEDGVYGKLFMIVAMIGAVAMLWLLLNKFRIVETTAMGQQVDMLVRDRVTGQLAGEAARSELAPKQERPMLPPAEDLISETAKIRAERQARIGEYISKKPKEAGRLLKVWLADA